MKTRYIKVSGDRAIPLPDRLQNESTHSLELSNAKYSAYTNADYFKVENGEPVAKTQAEVDAFKEEQQKQSAIKQAENLYESIRDNNIIEHNNKKYDLSDRFLFDYQQRKKNDNINVKEKNGKIKALSKADADAIELAMLNRIESAVTAYNADLDAIETGDYSLTNLKALEV